MGYKSFVKSIDDMTFSEFPKIHNFVDMTGQKVGKLTIIGYYGTRYKAAHWWCKCACGKYSTVSRPGLLAAIRLKKGGTVSCGCYRSTGRYSRKPYKGYDDQTFYLTAKNSAYGVYKNSAQKSNKNFELTPDEFHNIVQQNCHYCETAPSMIKKSTSHHANLNKMYIHNGIDRKDNNIGYLIENCLPCCTICNHAKWNLDYTTFIEWIKKAAKFINNG